ncbi:pseudouridine synthase [Cohnella hongkongensis]|uniref:Pseudouridine synthase n=1 Tax=Cohnella hongkongensis TaxID=178337 RepID=A0ABV9FIM9_9BACL
MKATIRLDKMLGNLGYGTRSEIKQWIKQGAVTVNGAVVKNHGLQVRPHEDEVALGGETIRYRDTVYALLHKPAGVVSATADDRDRTVIDLLDEDLAVLSPFPVGRLDKDTEGLLLLMNDGKLSHELLSPRKHVPKVYRALVAGAVGPSDAEAFERGVKLDDGYVTMPAQLKVLASAEPGPDRRMQAAEPADAAEMSAVLGFAPSGPECPPLSWIELTIREGKFHQVKRMFEAVGKKVLYLRRVAMGPLRLDPGLAPGEWRELTEDEVNSLRNYRKDGLE